MTTPRIRHPGEFRWETRLLAVVTLTLVAVGVAMCYAAGSYREDWFLEAQQQLSGAVVGGVLFLVAARLDYRLLRTWARPMFWATLAGLVVIAVVAVIWSSPEAPDAVSALVPYRNGARRWLKLGPLQLQISEIARFTLPVLVAAMVADRGSRLRRFRDGFVPVMVPIVLTAALVAVQPNLSMAILLTITGIAVAFVAGARISHLALFATPGVAGVAAMLFLSPERLDRLAAFLKPATECDPGVDQVCDSLIGLGNGGIVGVGFGQGTQKLGHLSYGHSDFILSVVGEEWGFLGVLFLALCFALFCWMGFRIARTARDPFGTALAGGLTAMVGTAGFMHAAVVLKLMPATGLTLPFISAGRVSLVMYLLSAGLLVAIGRRRGKPSAAR